MKVETSKGKTVEIKWMHPMNESEDEVMIELDDDRPISEIAADFENCQMFKVKNEKKKSGVNNVYEGYTDLFHASRSRKSGTVRLMVRKPEEE